MNWITRSFRNLLVTALIGLVLLLGVPTYAYISWVHAGQLVNERGQILHNLARSAATLLAENLLERSREVSLLAQSPLYVSAPLGSPAFRESLDRVQRYYPNYSWIGLSDLDGKVRAATGGMLLGVSVAERPWFQQALKGPYVGDLHEAKLLAKLLPAIGEGPVRFIDFAVPVRDASGQPRAVLGAHAHWNWSRHLIEVIAPRDAEAEGVEFFIVNRANEVIFPDAPAHSAGDRSAPAVGERQPAYYDWGSGTPYLTAAARVAEPETTVPLEWKVIVRQPRDKVLQHVTELQRAVSAAVGLMGLGFVLLAWFLSRQLGRPIDHLTRVAQAIAQGHSANFNLSLGTGELQRLHEALQRMSTQLLSDRRRLAAAASELEEKVALRTRELADANQALAALARRDALTALPNRLAANEFLAHEFQLLPRRPLPYAVLLLDIDYFKRVNDTYGHAVGDQVLRHVGALLSESVRQSDFVGRVGGEEFMAILPMTSLNDALGVAEKIRARIEASALEPVGRLTTSIGVAMAQAGQASMEVAPAEADARLYEAKRAGRNRVMPQLSGASSDAVPGHPE